MRAWEFIVESHVGSITTDVGRALPGAFKIPSLKNQDPYLQYRFGVAIAGAKGASKRAEDNVAPYAKESIFGENEIVVSYDPRVPEYIHDALEAMNMPAGDAVQIGSMASEEAEDVDKRSPIKSFGGYR